MLCCPQVLENNYRLKMMYSPDYRGVDTEQALSVSAQPEPEPQPEPAAMMC